MKALVMVGAPGSGKSTRAKVLSKSLNAAIISSDDICAELFGSASVQGVWGEIWPRIDDSLSDAVPGNVIMDGTNYREDHRAEIITLLKSYGYTRIEAMVVDVPLKKCLERNAQRERQVPEYVIRKMHAELRESLKNICLEDFNCVNFVFC